MQIQTMITYLTEILENNPQPPYDTPQMIDGIQEIIVMIAENIPSCLLLQRQQSKLLGYCREAIAFLNVAKNNIEGHKEFDVHKHWKSVIFPLRKLLNILNDIDNTSYDLKKTGS